jgi:hypothetical protein
MSTKRRMTATRPRRIFLRLRPKYAAQPWGKRSEKVRLTVVESSPGSSLLRANDWSATGLRKMLFLGGEVGVSHSGTSGCVVAIGSCRCYCVLYIAERRYSNEGNAMLAKWEKEIVRLVVAVFVKLAVTPVRHVLGFAVAPPGNLKCGSGAGGYFKLHLNGISPSKASQTDK